jgi:hypothetical protein
MIPFGDTMVEGSPLIGHHRDSWQYPERRNIIQLLAAAGAAGSEE